MIPRQMLETEGKIKQSQKSKVMQQITDQEKTNNAKSWSLRF